MLQPSLNQTVRAVQATIARLEHVRRAPRVLWAGLNEHESDFALRCARLQLDGVDRIIGAVPHGFTVPSGVQGVEFAPKLFWLLHPDAPIRYRAGSGGRGSGKSHAFAMAIILRMLERKMRVLCCREIMNSLRESVHHLLSAKIDALGLTQFFDITDREITCRSSGAEIIFAGLKANINALKSLEDITIAWIEEGESVSQRSFEILTPTIRATGSEVWLSMNPDDAQAPAQQYIDAPRLDTRHEHVTFEDNPWFPSELDGERLYLQSVDPDAYAHVWLGCTRTFSDAQVFKGKYEIVSFVPEHGWNGPYFGADWGFSQDPTTLIKCWVANKRLYIEREAYGVGVDIDRTPALFDQIEGAHGYTIRADNSRPETISHMKHNGYRNVIACEKWKGCAEDGVAHLRSYEKIIIHPECKHTADEMRLYSFKVDRLTNDVLPDLVDKFNHTIDALRYALEPLIKRRTGFRWTDEFRINMQR